jgi:hypothetical protein
MAAGDSCEPVVERMRKQPSGFKAVNMGRGEFASAFLGFRKNRSASSRDDYDEGGQILSAVPSRFFFPGRRGHPPRRSTGKRLGWSPLPPGEVGKESGEDGSKNSKTSPRGRGDTLYRGWKIFEKTAPKKAPRRLASEHIIGSVPGRLSGEFRNFFLSKNHLMLVGVLSVGFGPERFEKSSRKPGRHSRLSLRGEAWKPRPGCTHQSPSLKIAGSCPSV